MTVERRKEIQKKYRETHKEEIKKKRDNNKEINRDKKKIYNKKTKDKRIAYKKDNHEKIKIQKRKWAADNYQRLKAKKKELHDIYYAKNKEILSEKQKVYYEKNKDLIRKRNKIYRSHRKTIDPLYKLSCSFRVRIVKSFTENGFTKKSNTFNILGCTFEAFKLYLECQFEDWMNWTNRGLYKKGTFNFGWDIDHIIPLSTAITAEDIIRLNHYTNLQPLCSKINRDVKKNKLLFSNSLDKI